MVAIYSSVALRRLVYQRAKGRCEYCLMPELSGFSVHEYEHIVARKHGGATDADNLALSCAIYNRRKSSDLAGIDPETGEIIRLFHPRLHNWDEHFHLDGALIVAKTAMGRATANLLQFNAAERKEERELLIAFGQFQ